MDLASLDRLASERAGLRALAAVARLEPVVGRSFGHRFDSGNSSDFKARPNDLPESETAVPRYYRRGVAPEAAPPALPRISASASDVPGFSGGRTTAPSVLPVTIRRRYGSADIEMQCLSSHLPFLQDIGV